MLQIGMKGHLERTVTADLSAKVWGSGAVDVYATPCMIALVGGELQGARFQVSEVPQAPSGDVTDADAQLFP